ncbi:MAG: thiol:disulfide interchange protein DsbA/DsbL [Candidatus Wenzhouxiangella sp. M2_3B_020]
MKTNQFPLFTILAAFVVSMAAWAMPVQAQQYEEGTHYERITGPDVSDSDGTIEVVEAFSYMCPHCKNFQPHVSEWHENLPESVEFSRAPVVFRPSWEPYARAYYTAEVLGILDESHDAVFTALHEERRQLRDLEDLAEFHAQFGVDAEEFESTAESFPVESRLRMGNSRLGKWQVRSTPMLIINGKWRVSPRRGGTFEEMLDVADYLIAREQEAADADAASGES